jgi:alpha-tubulin suppressor-like RCC1 family protein
MCCVFFSFEVYAWGCGACLGCGSSEATALRPKLIEELAATRIVDISIGDSHCLALSHGKVIFCFVCAFLREYHYVCSRDSP